jgi:glycosyltransferase involved in cell wall biosynthesis
VPGASGGVETLVVGLAEGFSNLSPGDLDIHFITYAGANDWTHAFRGEHIRFTAVAMPGRVQWLKNKSRMWGIRRAAGSFGVIPRRDGVLNRLPSDVVHFPFQGGYRVRSPFIYHPHDLQHRHLPDFFDRRTIAHREISYQYLCRRAATVAVGTSWVKDDLIAQFGLHPDRISVIPLAPLAPCSNDFMPEDALLRQLPERYVVYPAHPWPHKNHARLIEALGLLRRRGIQVPLVLTGGGGANRAVLRDLAVRFSVPNLVVDLGYLPRASLDLVTSRAAAMVVPTLFEAASFPIWEAFRLGTPVACSDVTSLPRQVGDAGFVFDPHSTTSIASAVERLWTDASLRESLSRAARSRIASFTWTETARRFVALYRRTAGAQLSDEDRQLLKEEAMI